MKTRKILLISFILFAAWIAIDLLIPTKTDIRQFEPKVVAHLDTEMWRSYYDRKPLKLFFQLGTVMRKQFHAPFWRSQLMAFQAAKAAFVFKDGKQRSDYNKALPYLHKYYTMINKMSKTPFNVQKAAELELEWWIVHRQRAQHQGGDLEQALAESAAVIYNILPTQVNEYAKYRADAMDIRDREQENDGVSEAEWQRIANLLDRSWQALYNSINTK